MNYLITLFYFLISFISFSQLNLDWVDANCSYNNPSNSWGNRVKIDNQSNVVTIGLFSGTCDFDPSNNSTLNLTALPNGLSMYIQKISSSGQLLFAFKIDVSNNTFFSADENLFDLELGINNEIYISGIFKGSIDFDPGSSQSILTNFCGGTASQCPSDHDGFVLKLDSSGSFQWVRQIQFNTWIGYDSMQGIALNNTNSVYVLTRSVYAIPNTPIQNLTSNNYRLVCFDDLGNYNFQKVYNNFILPKNFTCYEDKIIFSGIFGGVSTSYTSIDGYQLIGIGANYDDLGMVQTDSFGNVIYAFNIGSMYRDFQVNSHTMLSNGSVIIIGHVASYNGAFAYNIDWDPLTTQNNTTISTNFDFVLSYNMNGQLNWVNIYQLGLTSRINAIAHDSFDNIYLLGTFQGNIDFNLGGGSNILVSSGTTQDIFLLKTDFNSAFQYVYGFGGTSSDYGNDLDVKNCDVAFTGSVSNSANFSPSGTYNIQGPTNYLAKYSCCQIPVDINLSGDTLTCINDQVTLSVNQPNTTLSWYNGNTLLSNNSSLLVTNPGVFTLNATNSSGCFGQDQVTIVADTTEPVLDYNLSDTVLTCQNPLIIGTLNLPSGNSGSWTFNNTVISTTTSSQINMPGNLVISTTGLNGCTNTDSIIITSTVTYPNIDFSVLDTLCAGQNLVLTASGNGQINWNPDLPNGSIVYPTVSQFFTANIIDSLGCENTDSVYVNVIQGPNLAVTSDTVCNGESANLSVTSATGTSIYWQTGQTIANISLTANQDTSIYVFGILNGCYSDTLFANITVLPNSTVEIEVNGDSVLCVGGVVNLVSSQINGNSWSTGQSSQTISISQPQWVILSNTNPNGCISQDSINITTSGFPCLEIIDVFSPNDDGINDYWEIPGIEAYPKAEVSIFNRWGQLLFFSVGYSTPWNGKFNNEPLPTGDYFYIIDLGNGTKFNGSMTLKK